MRPLASPAVKQGVNVVAADSKIALQRYPWKGLLAGLGQAVVIAASLFVFLRGWRRDIHVPFTFATDGLFYLMQSKSTVDNGWWWFNPMVGAPFGLDQLAFPANSNVDQLVVWMVSRLVPDALAAINLSWVLIVVMSGWAATWCLRRLDISYPSAIVAGTLFALSPYALYRNIAHFGMVVYLVPFAGTAALQLASGKLPSQGYLRGSGAVLLAGCALLGFDYVYYPFFGCFFILAGLLLGFFTGWRRRVIRAGMICLAVMVACTFLNLAPSLYSWSHHGKPMIVEDKVPAHSELFALKIRTLVSPASPHLFPPFRRWNDQEAAAQFPLETENANARLGVVGAIGFLALIGVVLVPSAAERFKHATIILGASRLTIAGLLLATIGGFGSLFNLLISPQIRAYARIFPFIDFFALASVGIFVDAFLTSRRSRIAAAVAVLSLGLIDQQGAAAGMNAEYADTSAQLRSLEPFVQRLESRLPARAMVLQLPFRSYLSFSTIARQGPFEHLKPYLVSHQIRWSFPALSNEQVEWQSRAARIDVKRLPQELAGEGFSAIVIDRNGYDDRGAAVSAAIWAGIGDNAVLAETERYIAFDISALARDVGHQVPAPRTPTAAATRVCAAPPVISIDQINSMSPPSPGTEFHVSRSEGLRVTGWAIDPLAKSPASGVEVVVDQASFPSIYGTERPDVAVAKGNPAYNFSGFVSEISAEHLVKGTQTLSVRVVAANSECYYRSPPITLVVD
jgi:phosphoglycerol transferase